MEIKAAIERLTPAKRVKLHALVWPEEDEGFTTPPRVREKLAEAARGTFAKRDRSSIEKILQSIE